MINDKQWIDTCINEFDGIYGVNATNLIISNEDIKLLIGDFKLPEEVDVKLFINLIFEFGIFTVNQLGILCKHYKFISNCKYIDNENKEEGVIVRCFCDIQASFGTIESPKKIVSLYHREINDGCYKSTGKKFVEDEFQNSIICMCTTDDTFNSTYQAKLNKFIKQQFPYINTEKTFIQKKREINRNEPYFKAKIDSRRPFNWTHVNKIKYFMDNFETTEPEIKLKKNIPKLHIKKIFEGFDINIQEYITDKDAYIFILENALKVGVLVPSQIEVLSNYTTFYHECKRIKNVTSSRLGAKYKVHCNCKTDMFFDTNKYIKNSDGDVEIIELKNPKISIVCKCTDISPTIKKKFLEKAVEFKQMIPFKKINVLAEKKKRPVIINKNKDTIGNSGKININIIEEYENVKIYNTQTPPELKNYINFVFGKCTTSNSIFTKAFMENINNENTMNDLCYCQCHKNDGFNCKNVILSEDHCDIVTVVKERVSVKLTSWVTLLKIYSIDIFKKEYQYSIEIPKSISCSLINNLDKVMPLDPEKTLFHYLTVYDKVHHYFFQKETLYIQDLILELFGSGQIKGKSDEMIGFVIKEISKIDREYKNHLSGEPNNIQHNPDINDNITKIGEVIKKNNINDIPIKSYVDHINNIENAESYNESIKNTTSEIKIIESSIKSYLGSIENYKHITKLKQENESYCFTHGKIKSEIVSPCLDLQEQHAKFMYSIASTTESENKRFTILTYLYSCYCYEDNKKSLFFLDKSSVKLYLTRFKNFNCDIDPGFTNITLYIYTRDGKLHFVDAKGIRFYLDYKITINENNSTLLKTQFGTFNKNNEDIPLHIFETQMGGNNINISIIPKNRICISCSRDLGGEYNCNVCNTLFDRNRQIRNQQKPADLTKTNYSSHVTTPKVIKSRTNNQHANTIEELPFEQCSPETFSQNYSRISKIGRGGFGNVYLLRGFQNKQIAAKSFESKVSKIHIHMESLISKYINTCENSKDGQYFCTVLDEFSIKQNTSTFNIICFDYFPHDEFKSYYKTIELKSMKYYLHGLFSALSLIHEMGLIHRDIKPNNYLFNLSNNQCKLIDFGITEVNKEQYCNKYENNINTNIDTNKSWIDKIINLQKEMNVSNRFGTNGFLAPEIILGMTKQNEKVDIWSVGCILMGFLSKNQQFFYTNVGADVIENNLNPIIKVFGIEEITKMVNVCDTKTHIPNYVKPLKLGLDSTEELYTRDDIDTIINEGGLELLKDCLKINPGKRISAKEALRHRFFNSLSN